MNYTSHYTKISLLFTKRRRDYGLPYTFTDVEPETLNVDYEPYVLEFPAETRMLHSVSVDVLFLGYPIDNM